MGDYFCALAHDVFSSGSIYKFLNQGLIKLILKNSRRYTSSGWQIISSLDVAYKIMAKALAFGVWDVAKKFVS